MGTGGKGERGTGKAHGIGWDGMGWGVVRMEWKGFYFNFSLLSYIAHAFSSEE